MNELEIIRKDIAPLQFKIFGLLIVLATNYKFLTFTFYDVNPWVFIIGNIAAVAIWTAKDILIIDLDRKHVREGFKVFGLRYADRTAFGGLEKIFINTVRSSEVFRQQTRTMTIRHEHYKAFLKTAEGDKYWIFVASDKDKLMKKLRAIQEKLQVPIYDYTEAGQVRVH